MKLKSAIVTAPTLATFQFNRKIFVTTGACKYTIVAVLEQKREDGRQPVAFISRTMSLYEQNYAVHDLELL